MIAGWVPITNRFLKWDILLPLYHSKYVPKLAKIAFCNTNYKEYYFWEINVNIYSKWASLSSLKICCMMQPLPEKITVLNLSFLAISTCGFTKKAVINNATTIIPRFVFHPLKLKKIIRLFSLKLFIKKLCLQFLPHFCTLSPLRRARGLRTTFLGLSSTAQPHTFF